MKPSEKVEQKLSEVHIYLEEKGLPHPQDVMVDQYLCMSFDELNNLDSKDLANIAYLLSCKSNYLQDFMNEKKVKAAACTQAIDKLVRGKVNDYPGFKYEERKYEAIMDNEVATKLYDLRENINLIILRMEYLPKAMQDVSHKISSIQRMRDNKNGY